MIAWGDIYKVVAAMAPLYFALGLGYGSVRWWRFFTAEQCDAINTLVVNFSMPFFTFDFLARADPYTMNYRVLAADAVSKLLAIAAASASSACCFRGAKQAKAKQAGGAQSAWAITGFSLAGFNNTLVVGVPLLYAMYGKWAQDLIVQIAVVQSLFWFPLLLLGFELRKAAWVVGSIPQGAGAGAGVGRCSSSGSDGDDLGGRVGPVSSSSSSSSVPPSSPPPSKKDAAAEKDVEMNAEDDDAPDTAGTTIRMWPTVRTVGLKLAGNPNVYASVLGVVWACIAYRYVRLHRTHSHHLHTAKYHVLPCMHACAPVLHRRVRVTHVCALIGSRVGTCACACRWDLSMPGIVTGSLDVMSKTGTGMSMFSMGKRD